MKPPQPDGKRLRTFRISFTMDAAVDDLMHQADLLMPSASIGQRLQGTITSASPLPFSGYKESITKAFKENGGKLHHIEEVIT